MTLLFDIAKQRESHRDWVAAGSIRVVSKLDGETEVKRETTISNIRRRRQLNTTASDEGLHVSNASPRPTTDSGSTLGMPPTAAATAANSDFGLPLSRHASSSHRQLSPLTSITSTVITMRALVRPCNSQNSCASVLSSKESNGTRQSDISDNLLISEALEKHSIARKICRWFGRTWGNALEYCMQGIRESTVDLPICMSGSTSKNLDSFGRFCGDKAAQH
ncbi:hypothetical protein EDD17DRAFT_1517573, partial [Pisolithus thermaeus]